MGTSNVGSAEPLSNLVARGEGMETQDVEDPYYRLKRAAWHLQRAAIEIELSLAERDADECEETVLGLAILRDEFRAKADFLSPPKPCWPPNVVPFVPRRVG